MINLTPVQNYIAQKATEILSRKLNTKVTIQRVRIDLLNHIDLQGLYVEDRQHDTLLYAGEAQVRITDWFFLRKVTPVLHYLGLHNTNVHLYRTANSSVWNYQFVVDAFSGGAQKKKTTQQNQFELDLKKIELQNVSFHMDDAWVGDDMDYDVGYFEINAKQVDFKKKLIDISNIDAEAVSIILRDYKGGRPDTLRKVVKQTIDTTAFNPDKWAVKVNELTLKQCLFNLESATDTPKADEFDPTHLLVKNISINASKISITGDTIHGQINHLAAQERCGLAIKEMRSKVTVSPNASICQDLYLETNHSKVQNYYAMHYKRFPDFTSYITNVVMETHLNDAIVDERDVAYFAPILRQFPTVLKASGSARGTVANLSGQHMQITDGKSAINGSFKMTGLPDIYKTLISFDGEILTTGAGILKYSPSLKDNPNIALERISFAYFKGGYNGYIENFAVNGTLTTNLGSVYSNVKMNLPDFSSNKAVYQGTLSTTQFNLGALLRQPDLGAITLQADVKGMSFDPEHAEVKTNATIKELNYKGYAYHNITAEGLLAHKEFNGTLLIDDPNLALAFYGKVDYSQKMLTLKAKANLLKSNFYALKLSKDTIEAVADFDLDCQASNLDNFLGTAKLYNIDIRRNLHRLNLDSIYINAEENDGVKNLTIQSNDITANIHGNYQLSKLPYSIQYYLSGYIPNYIKAPSKTAPPQDLSFSIKTRNIDSLLSVTTKSMRGFDNATINGTLNTEQQKLTIKANVPYGVIGGYKMTNISVTGDGSFNLLELNADVDNVSMADSIISGSLSVTTTLGNDSLHFTIATASPETNTSANISGQIVAKGDTLFSQLSPSQFYLNQTKWDIPAGNRIVYATNYLMVKNLHLQSGLQNIDVSTLDETSEQKLTVAMKELDLGQFGAWGGLAAYQPDGRINGTVNIDHIFNTLNVSANVKATNVLLGTDTIGDINIIGMYDGSKKLVSLDPQTGIYLGNASVTASGNMSLNAQTYQKLDGKIQFTNMHADWLSPFLVGYVSQLKGTINGTVNISGTSVVPDIAGELNLTDIGARIDFLGSKYQIPNGKVEVTNNKIDFGEIQMLDVHKNTAKLTGYISHNRLKDMELNIRINSPKFEAFDLENDENHIFYGNLIASIDQLSIRGKFNDITINIKNAVPADKSHIYIPVTTGGDVGTYSYVSFKSYGKNQEEAKRNKNKLSIKIAADMNDLAEMTLVLDPTTGDAINAKGTGHLSMDIPANNDIRMFGRYDIDEGDYSFTFKQLFFKRKFILNSGSYISFSGPFSQTSMNVEATYTTRARLYDLLSDAEKQSNVIPDAEISDAKVAQDVNVILHMKGSLSSPKLTFNVVLPENRSVGTYAYTKLERLNQDDRQLFDQVASLLLVGNFVPPEGVAGTTARSGAINNISEIISGTASSQLTNIVNKLLGNPDLAIDLKYVNYNLSDPTAGGINRNQLSLGVRKDYFNDRLIVEVGGKSDWGRPTSTADKSSAFNIAGDFRIQYLLNAGGGLRLNLFRTSDYDVTVNQNIIRGGIGISWRKTFDNLSDFFHGAEFRRKQAEALKAVDSANSMKDNGTQ